MCKFEEEIRLAIEEIASWSEDKKSSVQLEGIDKYFQNDKNIENESIQDNEKKLI